ncbi:MAG: 50S ribosomal protein L32 [Desulfurobacteriaceae bacterium]
MAVPKRKVSRTRRDKRRTHWKAKKPAISVCPNCQSPKLPHRVCKYCGFYKGKTVVEVEA